MARILSQAGADRVSDSAAKALADIATEISMDIAAKAVKLAQHAGRKTVHENDIALAKQ